jgi:hypothetical protein
VIGLCSGDKHRCLRAKLFIPRISTYKTQPRGFYQWIFIRHLILNVFSSISASVVVANFLQPLLFIVLLLLIINALNTQHDLIIVLCHPSCSQNFISPNLWFLLCNVFSKRWLVYAAGTNTDVCARNYLYPVFLLTKTQPRGFYQWISKSFSIMNFFFSLLWTVMLTKLSFSLIVLITRAVIC